jgi:hypothetical protein
LPLFVDFFHYMQGKVHFLFFVYHSLGTMLLKAFLVLLVFYSSIWSLFDFKENFFLCFPSLTFCIHLVFFFLNFVGVEASLFFIQVFLCFFSLFFALFLVRFFLPFYVFVFLYQFPMASICGPSFEGICLWSPLEEALINQHFSSFNNLEQHLEQEASRSYSLFLSTPFVMSSTPSIDSDVDLLWSKDGSNVYLNFLIFLILFKFMLKQIMLMMLQMLNLLMM